MTNKTMVKGRADTSPPYELPAIEPADVTAIHALIAGTATPEQQGRFVQWFVKATGVDQMTYRPDDRDTAFAEGKRFVGLQFFTLAKTKLSDRRTP
jgi:hypothetical protein